MRIRIRVGNADPDPGEPNEQIIANPCGSGFVSKALIRIRIQSFALLYFLSAASIRFDRTAWIPW